jgi:hypothetical protein
MCVIVCVITETPKGALCSSCELQENECPHVLCSVLILSLDLCFIMRGFDTMLEGLRKLLFSLFSYLSFLKEKCRLKRSLPLLCDCPPSTFESIRRTL